MLRKPSLIGTLDRDMRIVGSWFRQGCVSPFWGLVGGHPPPPRPSPCQEVNNIEIMVDFPARPEFIEGPSVHGSTSSPRTDFQFTYHRKVNGLGGVVKFTVIPAKAGIQKSQSPERRFLQRFLDSGFRPRIAVRGRLNDENRRRSILTLNLTTPPNVRPALNGLSTAQPPAPGRPA